MKIDSIERRTLGTDFELRKAVEASADTRTIRGYAAKFGTMSEPLMNKQTRYKFRETIQRGAFDGASFDDVRAFFNHNPNMVLARSKNGKGSLSLGVDETGLWYEFDAPNNSAGNDLLESIKRGDIDQSSFAFSIAEGGEEWKNSGDNSKDGDVIYTRTIKKISGVYDVSPVTEPAYADTSVAVRSLEQFQKDSEPEKPAVEPSPEAISEVSDWAARLGS